MSYISRIINQINHYFFQIGFYFILKFFYLFFYSFDSYFQAMKNNLYNTYNYFKINFNIYFFYLSIYPSLNIYFLKDEFSGPFFLENIDYLLDICSVDDFENSESISDAGEEAEEETELFLNDEFDNELSLDGSEFINFEDFRDYYFELESDDDDFEFEDEGIDVNTLSLLLDINKVTSFLLVQEHFYYS